MSENGYTVPQPLGFQSGTMIMFFSSGWNGVAHFQANGGTLVPYKAILGGISSISPYIGLNNGHYIWYIWYIVPLAYMVYISIWYLQIIDVLFPLVG